MTEMLGAVRTEMERMRPSEWLLWLVSIGPYAVGWTVGSMVRVVLWLVAALIAGYRAGRGE